MNLLTSILPYLAMHYVLGRQEIIQDCMYLLLLGFGSALASAFITACSAFRPRVIRNILMMTGIFGVYLFLFECFSFSFSF